jgi:hypothetical protein
MRTPSRGATGAKTPSASDGPGAKSAERNVWLWCERVRTGGMESPPRHRPPGGKLGNWNRSPHWVEYFLHRPFLNKISVEIRLVYSLVLNQYNVFLRQYPPLFMKITPPRNRSLCFAFAATICAGALFATAQAQTLVTSFENPPFAVGTAVGGVGNWVGSTGPSANLYSSPVTTVAYNGTQSFRLANIAGGTAFFGYTYYDATGDFIYNSLADTASFHFSLNGTSSFAVDATFARFDVIYSSSASDVAANNHRIGILIRYGEVATDPYEIQFFNAGSTNALAQSVTLSIDQSFLNLGADWNNFALTLDHTTGQAVTSINGHVLTGVNLSPTNFDENSHISGFRFTAVTTAGASGSTYYDYITVVPEPSTALLGLSAAALLGFRRRLGNR